MVLRRHSFFLLLALLYVLVAAGPKLIWFLTSKKTTAVFAFEGHGNALDQLPQRSSQVYFIYKNRTVWLNAPPGLGLAENTPVVVRFQPNDPEDAIIDNFRGIWLGTMVYGSLPFLVLIVAFAHPQIVPYRSRVVLLRRKPFIKVIQ